MYMTITLIVLFVVIGVIGCLTCILQICHTHQPVHVESSLDTSTVENI